MPATRRNVPLACNYCRQRKSKCDGAQPVCASCAARDRECDYSQSVDGRKANKPHRRIEELEQHIADLEAKIARMESASVGSSAASAATTVFHHHHSSTDPSSVEAELDAPATSSSSAAFEVLHISHTGDVTYRGLSSVPPHPTSSSGMFADYQWLNPFRGLESVIASFNLAVDAHEEFLKLYFAYLNGWSGFLDETEFRVGMLLDHGDPANHQQDASSGYSPFLHLAILAVSCHLCPNREQYGTMFLQAAYSLLASELERPRPTSVIGLMLLALEATEADNNSFAWILSGVITKVALGLGLHVNTAAMVEQGTMTPLASRLRDDAWWSLYTDEKMLAMFLGRPPSLSSADHNLTLPSDCSKLMSCKGNDPSLQLAVVSLSDICADVMRLFYNIRKDQRNAVRDAHSLKGRLRTWQARFDPRPFATPKSSPAIAALTLHNAVLVLVNRPFLHRGLLDNEEGMQSWRAALDTIDLARMYDEQFTLRKAPVTMSQTFYISAAFMVLVVADLHDQPGRQHERQQAKDALDRLVLYLTKLSETWHAAGVSLSALDALQAEYAVKQGEMAPFELSLDELLGLFLQPNA